MPALNDATNKVRARERASRSVSLSRASSSSRDVDGDARWMDARPTDRPTAPFPRRARRDAADDDDDDDAPRCATAID